MTKLGYNGQCLPTGEGIGGGGGGRESSGGGNWVSDSMAPDRFALRRCQVYAKIYP